MKGERNEKEDCCGVLCLASVMGTSVCAEGKLTEQDSVTMSGNMELGFSVLADNTQLGINAKGNAVVDFKQKDDGLYIHCDAEYVVFLAGQSDIIKLGYNL